MATKKPTPIAQLRVARARIEEVQRAHQEMHDRWMTGCHERERLHRELAVSNARCMKLKGIIEYLEDQAKNGND